MVFLAFASNPPAKVRDITAGLDFTGRATCEVRLEHLVRQAGNVCRIDPRVAGSEQWMIGGADQDVASQPGMEVEMAFPGDGSLQDP